MKRRKRRYVLRVRGEQVAETKARITDAIMHLHQEVGPRHTTVSAIAARAGVERLTVYRHFPDAEAMFAACSHRYLELNPAPQPELWAGESDRLLRTRRGLEEIYGYFRRTAALYTKAYADVDEIPALRQAMEAFDAHLRSLADDLASGWPSDADRPRRLVVLRHAVRFATWQSLEQLQVDDERKAGLILEWLTAPALPPGRPTRAAATPGRGAARSEEKTARQSAS